MAKVGRGRSAGHLPGRRREPARTGKGEEDHEPILGRTSPNSRSSPMGCPVRPAGIGMPMTRRALTKFPVQEGYHRVPSLEPAEERGIKLLLEAWGKGPMAMSDSE